jgi:energy-coupling factor transport system substrate-specific component
MNYLIYAVIIIILIALLAVTNKSVQRNGLRGLVMIALLTALASYGRAMFALFIPSVQPSSFIIIMAGHLMGPGAGLATGLLTGLLSNMLISITPYTIWQMLLWGLMGFFAGLLPKKTGRFALSAYGAGWGFVFGWVMNIVFYTLGLAPFTLAAYLAICVLSFPMDLAHAVTNAVLLVTLSGRIKKMRR